MKIISLENHPPMTAVFSAQGLSPQDIAFRAKTLIQQFNTSAVVVLRDTDTLHQTAMTAAASLKNSGYAGHIIYAAQIYDTEANQQMPLSALDNKYGSDFTALSLFSKHLGPTSLDIRSTDFKNHTAHLDRPYSLHDWAKRTRLMGMDKINSDALLTKGVTVTMSVSGGGTQIIDAPRDDFIRIRTQEGLVWHWRRTATKTGPAPEITLAQHLDPEKIWSAPDGAFVIMKSMAWDGRHLPCVHRSPARQRNGDPQERVVGVGFIVGRS
jgi:hypothetical protein